MPKERGQGKNVDLKFVITIRRRNNDNTNNNNNNNNDNNNPFQVVCP